MSAKITGLVWEMDLPREQKYVLLALADHAKHDGSDVFPSVALIEWKTGYCERRVQQLLRILERHGILLRTDRPGHTAIYRIDVAAAPMKEPWKGRNGCTPNYSVRGEIPQGKGVQPVSPRGEIPQGKGVQPVAPITKSNRHQPKSKPATCSRCGGSGVRASISEPRKQVVCECTQEASTA